MEAATQTQKGGQVRITGQVISEVGLTAVYNINQPPKVTISCIV